MKIQYQEDPREWRKSTLLTLLAVAVLSSFLRWRHILSTPSWLGVLGGAAFFALLACLIPKAFRGYYRFSTWAGYYSSQAVARVALVLLFVFLLIPLGLLFRVLGKDPLQLRRSPDRASYWCAAKAPGSLDRQF
jgi:hypothetical protein